MRTFIGTASAVIGILFFVSAAFANPAMLPKHPGYPMNAAEAKSPVTGERLANDTGQANAVGEKAAIEAAGAATSHTMQKLADPNNQRLRKSKGAGRLPQVDGPEFFSTDHVVKEATRMK